MRMTRGIFYGLVAAYLLAAIVLGGALKFYDKFWWWDDMLHAVSGELLVITGIVIGTIALRGHAVKLWFMLVFGFCFALAIGVLWEMYEFTSDLTLHTAMQQYDMPPQAIVMGASYQGMGLRDTMSDLINAAGGATLTVIVLSVVFHRRETLLWQLANQLTWRRNARIK